MADMRLMELAGRPSKVSVARTGRIFVDSRLVGHLRRSRRIAGYRIILDTTSRECIRLGDFKLRGLDLLQQTNELLPSNCPPDLVISKFRHRALQYLAQDCRRAVQAALPSELGNPGRPDALPSQSGLFHRAETPPREVWDRVKQNLTIYLG
jgi:hypothetical protein